MLSKTAADCPDISSVFCRLHDQDDGELWKVVLATLLHEARLEIQSSETHMGIFAEVGACSHWLRPHQTRLTTAGGFAWPSGYGGTRWSRVGLPEFDWSILLQHHAQTSTWNLTGKVESNNYCLFRIAIPTRTMRHHQAAIHTVWLSHNGTKSTRKPSTFFGFRKNNDGWSCVASGLMA